MTKPEISSIMPFFIVRSVRTAIAFYRDRLGFDMPTPVRQMSRITAALIVKSCK